MITNFNLVFKWIRYQNIMSVGAKPIYIELENFNKTLVTGHNGAGKSTFIEALTFLLYGKAFRNINKPLLINTFNKKGLVVEGELMVGKDLLHIKRGMKPTILEITKNGEPLKDVASSPEYQDFFETQILGINYNSFKQIIVLGTAGYTPFMELPSGKRRELVEDLLNVSVLGDMDKLNKSMIKQSKIEIDLEKTKLEGMNNERDSISSVIDSQRASNARLCESMTNEFKETVQRAKSVKQEIESIVEPIEPSFEPYQFRIEDLDKKFDVEKFKQSIQQVKEVEAKSLAELESRKAELESTQANMVLDVDSIEKLKNTILTDDEIQSKISDIKKPYLYVQKPDDYVPSGDVNALTEQIKTLDNEFFDIRININKNNDKISFYAKGGECPTCGRDCTSDDHSQKYIDLNTELGAKLDACKESKEKIQNEIDRIKLEETEHNNLLFDYNMARKQYDNEIELYLKSLDSQKAELIQRNNDIQRQIDKITNDHKSAYDQLYNDIVKIDHQIEQVKSKCELTVKGIQSEIDSIDYKKMSEKESITNEYNTAITNYKNQIENNKNIISAKNELYNSIVENAKNLKNKIDELQSTKYDTSKLESLDESISELKNKIAMMMRKTYVRGIISDMLKDNGIKSHIVKKYIPIFNKKINHYLSILGADYVFHLDENFDETIKSRGREEFSYFSFSEGEKARINISLMFTWRDISSIISGKNINLLCLDEVFDGSCDDVGIDGINTILDNMKSNVFIISHRKDALDESFDRHIKMVKQGRFAVMEDV